MASEQTPPQRDERGVAIGAPGFVIEAPKPAEGSGQERCQATHAKESRCIVPMKTLEDRAPTTERDLPSSRDMETHPPTPGEGVGGGHHEMNPPPSNLRYF